MYFRDNNLHGRLDDRPGQGPTRRMYVDRSRARFRGSLEIVAKKNHRAMYVAAAVRASDARQGK